jgi:diamine N-acetyltransferase
MSSLKGKDIFLRALEPTDLDFLYQLENDESIWEVSNTSTPYSRYVLKQYLDRAHRDIFDIKQLRLVICKTENKDAIGCIDFYDFDPTHKRVGVGIIIFSEKDKQKGFAYQSLQLICQYAFKHLNVHQVFANITEDNMSSIKLFEKVGFTKTGIKKDWIYSHEKYKNELHYQLINYVS